MAKRKKKLVQSAVAGVHPMGYGVKQYPISQYQMNVMAGLGAGLGISGAAGNLGNLGGLGSMYAHSGEKVVHSQALYQQQLAAHARLSEEQRKLERLMSTPEWWHENKRVPPVEPFDRFLGWIDLELRALRIALKRTQWNS